MLDAKDAYSKYAYDFNALCNGISMLVTDPTNACKIICDELNAFFNKGTSLSSFTCTNVLYTKNTDKDFFGIYVKPTCPNYVSLINKEESEIEPFSRYQVEFDSKLIDCMLVTEEVNDFEGIGKLTCNNIMALLLHDINKIYDIRSIKEVRYIIDAITSFGGKILSERKLSETSKLFGYAFESTLRESTSVFCKNLDGLVLADEFLRGYGLGQAYEGAIDILNDILPPFHNTLSGHYMVMNWYMSNYYKVVDYYDGHNPYVIGLLKKSLSYTGSELEKISIKAAIADMQDMPTRKLINRGGYINEASLFSKIKYSGMRAIEEDLYEFQMRYRNVETEYDAVYLMRQINQRMELIDDYLRYENLSARDRDHWERVFDKYDKLRDELSKKTVYNKKMYGLFIDYNQLSQMDQDQYAY